MRQKRTRKLTPSVVSCDRPESCDSLNSGRTISVICAGDKLRSTGGRSSMLFCNASAKASRLAIPRKGTTKTLGTTQVGRCHSGSIEMTSQYTENIRAFVLTVAVEIPYRRNNTSSVCATDVGSVGANACTRCRKPNYCTYAWSMSCELNRCKIIRTTSRENAARISKWECKCPALRNTNTFSRHLQQRPGLSELRLPNFWGHHIHA